MGTLRQSTHEGLQNPQSCRVLFTLIILVKDTDDYVVWDPHLVITAGKYEELEVDSVCFKSRVINMNVFVKAKANIVFGLLLLLTRFPSTNRKSATEIRTYNPASLLYLTDPLWKRPFCEPLNIFPSYSFPTTTLQLVISLDMVIDHW